MLNDADGYQGGVEADDKTREKLDDADALLHGSKSQVKADYNTKGQTNWRREAHEDFDFEASEQLKGDFAGRKAPDRHLQPGRNDGR